MYFLFFGQKSRAIIDIQNNPYQMHSISNLAACPHFYHEWAAICWEMDISFFRHYSVYLSVVLFFILAGEPFQVNQPSTQNLVYRHHQLLKKRFIFQATTMTGPQHAWGNGRYWMKIDSWWRQDHFCFYLEDENVTLISNFQVRRVQLFGVDKRLSL